MMIDEINTRCPKCGDGEGYIIKKYGKNGKFMGYCPACELRNVWGLVQ